MLGKDMKIIITTLLCFLLFSTPLSSFSYRTCLVKITDKENILKRFGGSDVWNPGDLNRPELEKSIKQFLKSPTINFITFNSEKILTNLTIYAIEYAGIVKDGKKIIVCQMTVDYDDENFRVCPKNKGKFEESTFSITLDGGCNIVSLYFDPNEKKIINLYCNGEA
jgi:hypothetical protein